MNEFENLIMKRQWFYRFKLPNGTETPMYIPDYIAKIHSTREEMLMNFMSKFFNSKFDNLKCIDLACHQGYFSTLLASKGCKEVLGIDIREQNIFDANLIKSVYGYNNLRFETKDVFNLDVNALGKFDLVLIFGLLYHLNNPVEVLKIARNLTDKVCLIETQLVPDVEMSVDWGNCNSKRKLNGIFGVVDESEEISIDNREANIGNISLAPSLEALKFILSKVGFSKVEVMSIPNDAYEQFVSGHRVVIVAYV